MVRILILITSLVATPLFAAELGDSYVKLFQAQTRLAQDGNSNAQYSLGEMYEQGFGTQVDPEQAYKWYEMAAREGDVRARHKLVSRSLRVSGEKRVKQTMMAADTTKQHELAQANDTEDL